MPMALKLPEAHCENEKIGVGPITPWDTQQNSLIDLSIHKAKILGSTHAAPKLPALKPRITKKIKIPIKCVVPQPAMQSAQEIKLDFVKYEKDMEEYQIKIISELR